MFYRLAVSVAALLAISAAGMASAIDGHYSGKAKGTSKGSSGYANPCLDLDVDMTIQANHVSGTTKRYLPSGKRSFTTQTQQLSGMVQADGTTAQLTVYGVTFPATVADNRVVGKFVGDACDYDFDVPRSH